MEVTLRGRPGHGSVPRAADNALVRAAEVVRRVHAYSAPTVITPGEFFTDLELVHARPSSRRLLCSRRCAYRRTVLGEKNQCGWAIHPRFAVSEPRPLLDGWDSLDILSVICTVPPMHTPRPDILLPWVPFPPPRTQQPMLTNASPRMERVCESTAASGTSRVAADLSTAAAASPDGSAQDGQSHCASGTRADAANDVPQRSCWSGEGQRRAWYLHGEVQKASFRLS